MYKNTVKKKKQVEEEQEEQEDEEEGGVEGILVRICEERNTSSTMKTKTDPTPCTNPPKKPQKTRCLKW